MARHRSVHRGEKASRPSVTDIMRSEQTRMLAAHDRLRAKLAAASATLTSVRDFAIATGNPGLLRVLGYTCLTCMSMGGHKHGCPHDKDPDDD